MYEIIFFLNTLIHSTITVKSNLHIHCDYLPTYILQNERGRFEWMAGTIKKARGCFFPCRLVFLFGWFHVWVGMCTFHCPSRDLDSWMPHFLPRQHCTERMKGEQVKFYSLTRDKNILGFKNRKMDTNWNLNYVIFIYLVDINISS